MKRYSIQIYFLNDGENDYVFAFHPEFGGSACSATGDTIQEAIGILDKVREEVMQFLRETGKEIPEPSNKKIIKPGDRVLVFDYILWEKIGGDKGDNSQFWKLATVKYVYYKFTEYGKCFDCLVDVIFDHGGLSKGHFVSGIRRI